MIIYSLVFFSLVLFFSDSASGEIYSVSLRVALGLFGLGWVTGGVTGAVVVAGWCWVGLGGAGVGGVLWGVWVWSEGVGSGRNSLGWGGLRCVFAW